MTAHRYCQRSGEADRPTGRQAMVRVAMPGGCRRPSLTAAPLWVLFVVRVLVILACIALLGTIEGLLGVGGR